MLTGRPTPHSLLLVSVSYIQWALTRHCKNISLWPRSLALTYRHVEDISLWPRSLTMARHVEDIIFDAACNLH